MRSRKLYPHVGRCNFDDVYRGGGKHKAQTHPTHKSGDENRNDDAFIGDGNDGDDDDQGKTEEGEKEGRRRIRRRLTCR